MHGYATFNMLIPGPLNCCRYEMCTARPWNAHSPLKLRSRDIGEKAKQNSARKKSKCSKCFQFLCNTSERTWFFNALTFARSLRGVENRGRRPRFSISPSGPGELMHEKPCLIPILWLFCEFFFHVLSFLLSYCCVQ